VLVAVVNGVFIAVATGVLVAVALGVLVDVLSTLSEVIGTALFLLLEQLHKATDITNDAKIILNNFICFCPFPD